MRSGICKSNVVAFLKQLHEKTLDWGKIEVMQDFRWHLGCRFEKEFKTIQVLDHRSVSYTYELNLERILREIRAKEFEEDHNHLNVFNETNANIYRRDYIRERMGASAINFSGWPKFWKSSCQKSTKYKKPDWLKQSDWDGMVFVSNAVATVQPCKILFCYSFSKSHHDHVERTGT